MTNLMRTAAACGAWTLAVAGTLPGVAAPAPEAPPALTFEAFRSPPAAWRSVPFWSLNDILEPAEIERQMEAFKAGGFGGAYLHSRIGLLTEYLGADWWKAMDAGVRAAERLGLEAWFYDEDKWPSGFAGGIVPAKDEAFRQRMLLRLAKSAPLPDQATVLAEDAQWRYVCAVAPMGDPWFNGTCWVDLLNPKTVEAFIECSYTPYTTRYAAGAGRTAFGIFTDEPQVSPRTRVPHEGAVPYSPILRDDFRREHGYDFVTQIAGLFENTNDFAKVRLDYFQTLGRRLERSFSQPIADACAKAGFVWTGHYNGENAFRSVQQNVGNMMIQYRHPQRPGIDHLGLNLGYDIVYMMRSLSSVANQYGRTRRLSEMFGIGGQNMNFEDRLWIAGGHAALGINHACPHLTLYSMKGCRKRDYPPTLSPQQPWWDFNPRVEDTMARMSLLSSVGAYAPELLVLVPLESSYIDCPNARGPESDANARFNRFAKSLEALQRAHRDFDLGDEQILADDGAVDGATLKVGVMRYPAVLVPHFRTIRATTLARLEQFAAGGGLVAVTGGFPDLLDGRPDPALSNRLARIAKPLPADGLADAFSALRPPLVRLSGPGADDVWIMRRTPSAGEGQMVMFFNRSRLATADVKAVLPNLGNRPVVWDPTSGECLAATPEADGALALRLAPAQSLFVSSGAFSEAAKIAGAYRPPVPGTKVLELTGPWQGRRLDPNALTLDFARWSTNGGASFGAPEPVLGIHERFTRLKFSGPLLLAFDFAADVAPADASLVLEQPAMYRRIELNGAPVDFAQATAWRDFSFRRADLAGRLRAGTNTVTLGLDYVAPVPDSRNARTRYGTEIESIYVLGSFAVAATRSAQPAHSARNERGELVPRPVHRWSAFRLAAEGSSFDGDLAPQGYPFYAGRFELTRTFAAPDGLAGKRVFLAFPAVEAIVVGVEVNGKALPSVAWSPWEVDVTDALKSGENTLKVTLVNSLRNLLGPHHHPGGELTAVGPLNFGGGNGWPTYGPGDSDWYDVRRTREPKLWRDDYHGIGLGFLQPPVLEARDR